MNLGELSLEKKYRIFLNVTMSNEGLYEAQLRNFEEVPSIKKFEKFNIKKLKNINIKLLNYLK